MSVRSHLLPAARRDDATDVGDVHPPKVETYDVPAMTTVDPKGYAREVDEYRLEPFGLYVAREVPGHPTLDYRESWLLPELGIQITDWYFTEGNERDQDFYIDIAQIQPGGPTWRLVDLYLDVVVRTGRGLDVLDVDELLAAVDGGFVDSATARSAIETSHRTVEGIAAHGYHLAAWLATAGIELTWRRR